MFTGRRNRSSWLPFISKCSRGVQNVSHAKYKGMDIGLYVITTIIIIIIIIIIINCGGQWAIIWPVKVGATSGSRLGKGKVRPKTAHEGSEGEQRYSSTLSLISALKGALKGVGGQRHAPAALPPGNTRYTLYRKMGGPHGRSWQVGNISVPPGFDHRTVQPVASRYTDYVIPAHIPSG